MPSLARLLCPSLILTAAILFHSSWAAYGQSTDAKPKATGSISGRVTVGDKAAPGIMVVVTPGGGFNRESPVGQGTTDSDGNYRIARVPSGQFTVLPIAPVFVIPRDSSSVGGKTLILSEAETVEGIDFKLTRGGVITGRVTDADNRPVIEERVNLSPVDDKGAPARMQMSMPSNQMYQTDDRGVYRFYGLPAGRYTISVGDDSNNTTFGMGRSGFFQRTYHPDALDPTKATVVEVGEGTEARDVNIKLGRRAPTYTATGRVVDAESGQPVTGVGIGFGIMRNNNDGDYLGGMAGSSPTNARGEFRLVGLEPGRYGIYLEGFSADKGAGFYSDPVLFEVVDSDVGNLEVRAQHGLSLSGVVVLEGEPIKDLVARLSKLTVYANVFAPDNLHAQSGGASAISAGVIAGTITDSDGRPVVNAIVRAFRVRDVEGKPVSNAVQTRERFTDDRGYYRLYGLRPGAYVVSVGGRGQISGFPYLNQYEKDAPTYAPSSTRDTATEIMVRSGQEGLADIRYRGEAGHSISGKLGGTEVQPGIQAAVRLVDAQSHIAIATTSTITPNRTFELMGISDGEYEIVAMAAAPPGGEFLFSRSQRVTVRGTDVVGMELALAPVGSITGRVVIERDPQLNCGMRRDTALREIVITTRRDPIADQRGAKTSRDKSLETAEPPSFLPSFFEVAPNDKGEITARNLAPGVYRFETRLPGSGWYLKSISMGPPDQTPAVRIQEKNIARDGVTVKSGDKLAGVAVTITENGASLRGHISPAEGQRLPPGLRVYVVPAERESAENVLRFFEVGAESDGSFAIGNIAPGKYWIIVRPAEESDPGTGKSIRQDTTLRSRVLREAEALKKDIPFKPCERTTDYDLPYSAAPLPRQ